MLIRNSVTLGTPHRLGTKLALQLIFWRGPLGKKPRRRRLLNAPPDLDVFLNQQRFSAITLCWLFIINEEVPILLLGPDHALKI